MTVLSNTAGTTWTPAVWRQCGLPKKSGDKGPCANTILDGYPYLVACPAHMSEQDKALRAAYMKGLSDGGTSGEERGYRRAQLDAENAERQVKRLAEIEASTRYVDHTGRQIVCVGKYAYTWDGTEPLAVGDRVRLPGNWLSEMTNGPGAYVETITSLGSDYSGPMSAVIGRVTQ